MKVIVVRGATGVCIWTRRLKGAFAWDWLCTRDQLVVPGPDDSIGAEACAISIAQHSAGLVGAIAQVVELDL
jgi:hypothetical protein